MERVQNHRAVLDCGAGVRAVFVDHIEIEVKGSEAWDRSSWQASFGGGIGGHRAESFLEQDLIVVSPGVPAKLPELELARARGTPVWSEIELAWRFLRGKLIAITGSNGKTTTTSLVAHILQAGKSPRLIASHVKTLSPYH